MIGCLVKKNLGWITQYLSAKWKIFMHKRTVKDKSLYKIKIFKNTLLILNCTKPDTSSIVEYTKVKVKYS